MQSRASFIEQESKRRNMKFDVKKAPLRELMFGRNLFDSAIVKSVEDIIEHDCNYDSLRRFDRYAKEIKLSKDEVHLLLDALIRKDIHAVQMWCEYRWIVSRMIQDKPAEEYDVLVMWNELQDLYCRNISTRDYKLYQRLYARKRYEREKKFKESMTPEMLRAFEVLALREAEENGRTGEGEM